MDLTNAKTVLCIIAIGLAVLGIVKPQWPSVAVAVLLVAVAVLIGK